MALWKANYQNVCSKGEARNLMPVADLPTSEAETTSREKLTVFVLTHDWSGLHQMFEDESFEKMAGVPLVPMLWKVLAEKGHDVHVFVIGQFSSSKDFMMGGFHVHRICPPPLIYKAMTARPWRNVIKIGWLWTQRAFKREVNRVAGTNPPDVIYSYRSDAAWVGFRLCKKHRSVHIGRRWGTWLGHTLFNVPWYRRVRDLGEIISYKVPYDMLIMSNDGTLGDKVAERLNYPQERHRFWLDGTKRGIYDPEIDVAKVKESVGLKSDDLMIFSVARLDTWKRLDRAIGAMPTVIKRVPNARLVIGGDGPLRPDLEAQIERLGVGEYVTLLGSIPHATVRELHNAADLFLTVQDLTNLGNQIMEAMHSKTCVIAYDVGGTRDVMVDGQTGLLLSKEQLPQLGERVAELLEDEDRRQKLAVGAFEFAQENIWFWDERIQAEIDLVHELVDQKRRSEGKRKP
ncbi:MAG: glycosyltransferase family 4 protein [Planctomycetaceae bacterium]|nr:glycosyltransferase family 4 protein [Planctomycetaceae bacterium]